MDLRKLFQQNTTTPLPSNMLERVMFRIEMEIQKRAQKQRYIWGIVSISSLFAFIGSCIYAFEAFSTSGFGNYFSLMLSDSSSALLFWRQLGLSLIESLPVVGVILLLASISLLLWSIRRFSKYTGTFASQAAIQTA